MASDAAPPIAGRNDSANSRGTLDFPKFITPHFDASMFQIYFAFSP